jgi:hypothetical protein
VLPSAFGQDEEEEEAPAAIGYEVKFDDPYDINKLFVGFIPLYGEAAATNMTIGFGLVVDYLYSTKFDFNLIARTSYGKRADWMRYSAEQNVSGSNSNNPRAYNFVEFGGTYHFRDFEEEKPTKVFLYSKKYTKKEWAAMVIKTTEVQSKVRKIYGARLGGMFYNTSFDMNRAMENQGTWLYDDSGAPIDSSATLYGNMRSLGFYMGASMSWFRNFSVEFEDEYDPGGDDYLLTTYFDILLAPSVKIEDIIYQGDIYSTEDIAVSNFGFRLGAKGKYNRKWSWGYGAELGYRPSVKKQGFFVTLMLSLPLYSTNLKETAVETFEQE